MDAPTPLRRDLVVIGASAGGLAVLQRIARELPPNFPAAVLVVLHVGARRSLLPGLLRQAGPNPAMHARDGQALRLGTIYVAPPDRHLLVLDGHVRLTHEAKENFARPAIDPLFRSAALTHGARTIGVVLSGRLDDGTAGLQAIKEAGGIAIVQDPADAEEPEMPANALANVDVDHVVPASGIAALLAALAGHVAPAGRAPPDHLRREMQLTLASGDPMAILDQIGTSSAYTCPECHGSLWRLDGRPARFRCHTGHAYSLLSLRHGQQVMADQALWSALRALQERERLLLDMATTRQDRGDIDEHARLEAEAEAVAGHRDQLHRMLTHATPWVEEG